MLNFGLSLGRSFLLLIGLLVLGTDGTRQEFYTVHGLIFMPKPEIEAGQLSFLIELLVLAADGTRQEFYTVDGQRFILKAGE